jgi:hypothetical protein
MMEKESGKPYSRVLAGLLALLMVATLIPTFSLAGAKKHDGTIISVDEPSFTGKQVPYGTKKEDLNLPAKLNAVIEIDHPSSKADSPKEEVGSMVTVEWRGSYDSTAPGTYTLTPKIKAEGYKMDSKLNLPTIEITVKAQEAVTENPRP